MPREEKRVGSGQWAVEDKTVGKFLSAEKESAEC